MKKLFILLIILVCSGCSSSTPNTDKIIDVASNAVSVMQQQVKSLDANLPKENFEAIKKSLEIQINNFPEMLEVIKSNCKTDVSLQVYKTRKWQIAFFSLLICVIGFVLIKRRIIL